MHVRTVHLSDGTTVDSEKIELVSGEDAQQVGKRFGRIKSQAGLHCEGDSNGLSQSAHDRIDTGGFPQEAAPGTFPINDRGWASQIQVDGRDGILLKFTSSADEGWNVIPDH